MFFDIHAHLYKYPYPIEFYPEKNEYKLAFPNEKELIETHDKLGIDGAVILPLVSSEVYLPQSVGEIIEICDNSGGRFIPFCNVDPRVLTNSSDAPIGMLLEYFKEQGCKGLGEVLPKMEFRDPKMQNLFRHCERVGFPLLFDLSGGKEGSYGIYDDAGLPQLEKCLNSFPDLVFIGHGPAFWAELGSLRNKEDRFGYPNYPIDAPGSVPRLLRKYPNLWVDLSAGSGSIAMYRDKEYSVSFLNEFSDRIMFGTDICFANDPGYGMTDYLISLKETGKLPEEKFEAIAYKNAKRLLHLDTSH